MAIAKLVCGDCGAELAPGDRRCGGCGAAIESPVPPAGGGVRCPSCGAANTPQAEICHSCGARLGKGGATKSPTGQKRSPARKFESWHLFSGAALLLLVAYLVYSNLGGNVPPAPSGGNTPGMTAQMPIEQHVHTIDLAPLEEAVRARPDDLDALLKLANALHDNGAWQRAIEVYGRYLQRNPGNPDARVDMGICYFELSRVDTARSQSLARRAVEEMERAAKESPTHQQAAFNLGIVLLNTGDVSRSNRWFARAVEIDGQSELGRQAQSILSQHRTLTP